MVSKRTPLANIAISVIGASEATSRELEWAEHVGRHLGEAGALLICGGRGGVMEAACRGASGAGGLAIGILPSSAAADANPYVTIPILTGLGEARNVIVAGTSHAVIAIGGSYGTLSEIALALRAGIPVVGLHTWQATRSDGANLPIERVNTPQEAAQAALELAYARPGDSMSPSSASSP